MQSTWPSIERDKALYSFLAPLGLTAYPIVPRMGVTHRTTSPAGNLDAGDPLYPNEIISNALLDKSFSSRFSVSAKSGRVHSMSSSIMIDGPFWAEAHLRACK